MKKEEKLSFKHKLTTGAVPIFVYSIKTVAIVDVEEHAEGSFCSASL